MGNKKTRDIIFIDYISIGVMDLKKVCAFVCVFSQNYVYLIKHVLLRNPIISSKMKLFELINMCSTKHVVSLIN